MAAEYAAVDATRTRQEQHESQLAHLQGPNPPFRACDRCRLRKSKCRPSAASPHGPCDGCTQASEHCRFDLPVNRRGPKIRKGFSRPRTTPAPILARLPPRGTPQFISSVILPPEGSSTACEHVSAAATLRTLARRYSPPPYLPGSRGDDYPGPTEDLPDYNESPGSTGMQDLAALVAHGRVGPLSTDSSANPDRWRHLTTELQDIGINVHHVMQQSVDLFFKYLFPLTPLVHEPSVRKLLADLSSPQFLQSPCPEQHLALQPGLAFSLLTSIAATSAFFLPKDIFPEGNLVAEVLLASSRSSLNDFMEEDLSSPSAASIAVRYFHSNCLHAAGKPRHSWIIFGEASRLAQAMRLYDESALADLAPMEAELRRRSFWILYMGDKSAAILNNRPITMHKYSFETGITTLYPSPLHEHDLSPTLSLSPVQANTPRLTESISSHGRIIVEGFNANLKLWQISSDILLQLRMINERRQEQRNTGDSFGDTQQTNNSNPQTLTNSERSRLEDLNIQFVTCLDTLPLCLQSCTGGSLGQGLESIQSVQYIVQCVNLQVSVHSLRMILAEKLEDASLHGLAGMTYSDLQKTEIARDMLRVVQEAPFWSLQVNGEPCVEKIRLIGASLLKIIASNGSSPIAARARTDCLTLLNVLAKLDSRASDSLRNDPAWDR